MVSVSVSRVTFSLLTSQCASSYLVVPSITSIMVVPESIRDKVGPLPDVSSMNKGK